MQHINLYDSSLRKPAERFTANALAAGLAIIFVGLLAYSLLAGVELYVTNSDTRQAQASLARLQAQMKKLENTLPKVSLDKSLPDVLARKQQEIIQKQAVLDILSERTLGNTDGFVEHLAGFARQHIQGLWLTNVKIEQGGTQLSLSGHALKPEYVPQYLQKLSNESVLQGTQFKSFVLQSNTKKRRQVDFQITTQAAGELARAEP